jgi:NitT/TauT family transport system substrate-binding protein
MLTACNGSGATTTSAISEPTSVPQETTAPSSSTIAETEATVPESTTVPEDLVELTISTGFAGISYSDLYVGIEEGYFAEEGLDVSFLATNTAPGTALLSGESHINSGQPAAVYIPNAQGAGIVAIYSPTATFEAWVAKDPISSVEDIDGTTMGVFSLQDLDVIYTSWMLEQHGMSLDNIEMVASGGSSDKLAAVLADAVDVAPLYAPANFVGVNEGLNEIFDTRGLDNGQVPTFYIVLEEWAAENEDAVVGFIRALNRAHEWLFDSANTARGVEIVSQYTETEPSLIEEVYELYFTTPGELYSVAGEWDQAVVELMAEELVTIGLLEEDHGVTYESTIDLQYLEAAAGS